MLSTDAMQIISKYYRTQLATAHESDCPLRFEAEHCLLQDTTTDKTILFPPYMASVLPEDCLEVMEHPFPRALIQERIDLLEQHAYSVGRSSNSNATTEIPWTFPPIDTASDFRLSQYDINDPNDSHSLISRMCTIFNTSSELAFALAILGWKTKLESKSFAEMMSSGSVPHVGHFGMFLVHCMDLT